MGGGLMQLVAYGSQDVYLTGNPQITFWKAIYKRHTNFAMENIQQSPNGTAGLGQTLTINVARSGDLVQQMYLRFSNVKVKYSTDKGVSAIADSTSSTIYNYYEQWCNKETSRASWPAEQFISEIDFSIGGQRIDKHPREWFRMYDNLYHSEEQKKQWAKLTCPSSSQAAGSNPIVDGVDIFNAGSIESGLGTLVLPLLFTFNRHAGSALPLVALQYHDIKVNVKFTPFGTTNSGTCGPTEDEGLSSTEFWANYIYLDTDERRRFAKDKHEYLIEQLQHKTASISTTNTTNTIRLDFNHPVKELIWCSPLNQGKIFNDCLVPYDKLLDPTAPKNFGKHYQSYGTYCGCYGYRYTGDGTGMMIKPGIQLEETSTGKFTTLSYLHLDNDIDSQPFQFTTNNFYTDSGTSDEQCFFRACCAPSSSTLASLSHHPLESLNGPLDKCKIKLNGQDRFSIQNGEYFNGVQPYQHHTGAPTPGIYVYSFAIRPQELQPSGTCNFSRIDNAQLIYTPRSKIVSHFSCSQLNIFATNYNVLRIESGMGGLAYAN